MDGYSHTSRADEVPLTGGIATPGVVRTGDTVRRPLKPDSDLVHAFIEGFAPPHNGFRLTENGVRAGAQLVRSVHDLSEGARFAAGRRSRAIRTCLSPNFIFRDAVRGAMEWAAAELAYVQRNADEFRMSLS
jgi:hypothetical protein